MTDLEKQLKKAKQQYIQSLEFLSDAVDVVISTQELVVEMLEDQIKELKDGSK